MNYSGTVLSCPAAGRLSLVCRGLRKRPRVARYVLRITILLLLAAFLSGCDTYRTFIPAADYYYLNPNKKLTTIGRVAIVELDNDSSYPQISTDMTKALFQALQKKQVFGLTLVSRQNPSWQSLQLDLNSKYTLEQISAIHQALECDGLLIGTITEFRPYPHMVIGLRLKLLDLRDGQLLWALEQVWDSVDKTTEYRIKRYFQSQKRSGFAPLYERLAVVSPLEFIKFVSYEVSETL